ncbi:MAG: hypothetical protein LBK53_05550 [Heliobacteriaceae bacterium]|nr:hypothetical protein [Heliobacteriaceae bacterium]
MRGACTASDEAIQSKTLNLPVCRVVPPSSCHAEFISASAHDKSHHNLPVILV